MNEFDFSDLTPVEIPVKYQGVEYILTEADGAAAAKYRASMLKGMEISVDDEGNRTTKHIAGISEVQPLLVSLCLKDKVSGTRVPLETVKTWSERIIRKLFDKAKEISELDEQSDDLPSLENQLASLQKRIADLRGGTDPAKKLLASTTDG